MTTPDTGLSATPPAVPDILSPMEGEVFSNYPRLVTMTWAPVSGTGAVTYRVEIEEQDPNDTWADLTGEGCDGVISTTTCQFTFSGKNPGRVRIQAVDGTGHASVFSDWLDFTYTV